MSNDCTYVLSFTATMAPHGTVISLGRNVRNETGLHKRRMVPPLFLTLSAGKVEMNADVRLFPHGGTVKMHQITY